MILACKMGNPQIRNGKRDITKRGNSWFITIKTKKDKLMKWRCGRSGWVEPEGIPNLIPYFNKCRVLPKRGGTKIPIYTTKLIKTILLISDKKDIYNLLKRLLGKKYKVNIAISGREGISFVKRHKPDLILLDIYESRNIDEFTFLARTRRFRCQTVVVVIVPGGDEDIKNNYSIHYQTLYPV